MLEPSPCQNPPHQGTPNQSRVPCPHPFNGKSEDMRRSRERVVAKWQYAHNMWATTDATKYASGGIYPTKCIPRILAFGMDASDEELG